MAWRERDPDLGWEVICLYGHRRSEIVPLDIPAYEMKQPGKRGPQRAGQML